MSSILSRHPSLSLSFSLFKHPSVKLFSGVFSFGAKDKQHYLDVCVRCSVVSNPLSQDVIQKGLAEISWRDIVEDDIEREAIKVTENNEVKERVEVIKSMLASLNDGEITVSAYDTAWVALVEDVNGKSVKPQFPAALQWITKNQLSDGSWGDRIIFSAHDRILNTLACVVALKSWNIYPEKCEKGERFLRENIFKLECENPEHMPIGFEVAFPSLLEVAKRLGIQIPYDAPVLEEIYSRRNIKLTRIPKDVMHRVPTTLLHSLEGMAGLDWEKLLNLQCKDGSFLFSPSSTAFALMQTRNENCLKYLESVVKRFSGGVPNVYPVDLFEHTWIVDRLQRLGISRYFQPEINKCIAYISRYWNDKGICWARNSEVHDIDDTAMAFRILRSHGYKVSADAFQQFKKGEEFICFAGQSTQAVTGMFNLLRASQLQFPGETILEDARNFSSEFLSEKQAADELFDKWIIMKDLAGEVSYALDMPWYASLPRLETKFYIEQYGGEDDIWIGKTLYRMPYVNNNIYLELAKSDYNNCQALHRIEWDCMERWYEACDLGRYGMTKSTLLVFYFLAAANLFEPEKSRERIGWTKTAALVETIHTYFDLQGASMEERMVFLHDYRKCLRAQEYANSSSLGETHATGKIYSLVATLLGFLSHHSLDALVVHGHDIRHRLSNAWEKWLLEWVGEGDRHRGVVELLVETIILSSGNSVLEQEVVTHPDQYQKLSIITNNVCYHLSQYHEHKVQSSYVQNDDADRIMLEKIDLEMQELGQAVLDNSLNGISSGIKQTFLTVAKGYYYIAYCDQRTINYHIAKVLFERAE